jgi:hypothetical protein
VYLTKSSYLKLSQALLVSLHHRDGVGGRLFNP